MLGLLLWVWALGSTVQQRDAATGLQLDRCHRAADSVLGFSNCICGSSGRVDACCVVTG